MSRLPTYRNLVFTINNPDLDDSTIHGYKEPKVHADFTYICFQLEEGKCGTVHWQGYAEFRNQISKKNFYRKLGLGDDKCWCTPRDGTSAQARDYCFKDDVTTRWPGQEFGLISSMGERWDIKDIVEKIKIGEYKCERDIFETNPYWHYKFGRTINRAFALYGKRRRAEDMVQVILVIGKSGTGKTRWVHENYPNIYVKPTDEKGKDWWEGYEGETEVLFDDFRGEISVGEMLQILDRYPKRVSQKGTSCQLRATTFIITTNDEPEHWLNWHSTTEETWNAFNRRITCKKYL